MNITTKTLFMILFTMIYASQSPAQWNLIFHDNNSTVNCITANESTCLIAGFESEGIYYSYNDGLDWYDGWTGLTNYQVRASTMAVFRVNPGVVASVILAGTWGDGVFRLSTGPWDNPNTGLSNLYISALCISRGLENYAVLAGTWGGGVFISNDAGISWTAVNTGITNLYIRSLLIDDSYFFAGSIDGLFRKSVNEDGWVAVNNGLTDTIITALAKNGGYLFAGTRNGGVFRSSDNGDTWIAVNTGLGNLNIAALVVSPVSSGTIIVAATWGDGIYYTINNGVSWIEANEGMTSNLVRSLLVFNNFLFAGNDDGTIWRRPLSDFSTTDVHSTDNQIAPKDFSLFQNYPNPFNPTTTIEFQIPQSGQVKLTVYDLFGREVKTLINKEMRSGSHQCVFDGSGLASGVYLYRLQANGLVQSKKFVLLK